MELEEAAYIDGAGKFCTFRKIVVPLGKPIVILYLVMQKYIIGGVMAGAVKG